MMGWLITDIGIANSVTQVLAGALTAKNLYRMGAGNQRTQNYVKITLGWAKVHL